MAGNTHFMFVSPDIDDLLRDYTPYLRKKINPMDICNDLRDLTTGDRQRIECQTKNDGEIRGMDRLLECIGRRPRNCFFDFLVLLENNGYSEKSKYVINKSGLANSGELAEARERYQEQKGCIVYDRNNHQIPNTPEWPNPVPNQMTPHTTANQCNISHEVGRDQPNLHNVPGYQTGRGQPSLNNVPNQTAGQHLPNYLHNVPHQTGRDQPNMLFHTERDQPRMMLYQTGRNQSNISQLTVRDQDINNSNPPKLWQHHQRAPCEEERFDTSFQGKSQQPNIPGRSGQNVHTFYQNPDQDGKIPHSDNNSQMGNKYKFDIDLTQIHQGQITPDNNVPPEMSAQLGSPPADVHGGVAGGQQGHSPVSNYSQQTGQSYGQQRERADQMDTGQFRVSPNEGSRPLRTGQSVSFSQQGAPERAEGAIGIGDITDDVFQKLVEALSHGGESELWKQVGRKAGVKRSDMRLKEVSPNPAQAMLDMLDESYDMTIKQLGDILRQTGCFEALRILEGKDELPRNIDVSSDDENVKINNLNHHNGRSPQLKEENSCEFNTKITDNIVSFRDDENSEKVIENVTDLSCREPQEHEHSKCETFNQEIFPTMSDDCSKDTKSAQLSEVVPPREENQNQGERTVEAVEAETDKETKSTDMDVVSLSRDISANIREGEAVDEIPDVIKVSISPNRSQNFNVDSTQSDKHEEILAELSGVQAQGDANCSQSEKPLSQEVAQLQTEIHTQPNISSFRDLQRSIPTHQGQSLSTLSVSSQDQSVVGATNSDRLQDQQEKDLKQTKMSQVCSTEDKSTLSKNNISEGVFLPGRQLIQSDPGFASQELSVCEEGDSFFNNKAVFGNPAASMSNKDVPAFKAEGDENFKQSALPPEMDNRNFQREIEIQQHVTEETQQNNSTSSDAPPRQTMDSLPHIESFRDVQNSIPEYRNEDLENPDSSLPRNVDSLVMDEDETFLKEKNRPL